MKSRKKKQKLREVIRYALTRYSLKKAKDIKLIYDDYWYWQARCAHEILHPKTPKEFYVCR